MKGLSVTGVILTILALYFVVNAEKEIFLKGSEVIPVGTDIPKLILNSSKSAAIKMQSLIGQKEEVSADNALNNLGPMVTEEIKEKALELKEKIKDLSPQIQQEVINLIKKPIENKINETICPQ